MRAPPTATEAPTLPRERPGLGRPTPSKEREKGIPRGETPRGTKRSEQEWSCDLGTPGRPHAAALLLQPAPALGCPSPAVLLRRLPQMAALGEWLNGLGCPVAHPCWHTPASHALYWGGYSTAMAEVGVGLVGACCWALPYSVLSEEAFLLSSLLASLRINLASVSISL